MDVQKKIELITRNTDEVLTTNELRKLIEEGVKLKHYIGFEISGLVHIGTGVMTGMKIADFQKACVDCSCYLATYHAWINNKLRGDLDTIRQGAEYFKEGLKAGMLVAGANPEKVKFVSGDELYHHNDDYWRLVIDIAKKTTLNRGIRATTIMGRSRGEKMPVAWLMYAPMQAADIFIQEVNLAHAGVDQRKAHVLAREVALKIIKPLKHKNKPYKPIAVHNHLLLGLQKPPIWPIPKERATEIWSQMKMSKSVPASAVFIHDSPEEIRKKMMNAFCPEGNTEFNPVLDWAKHLLFAKKEFKLVVKRPAKYGGKAEYNSYKELEADFALKKLHPLDLKKSIAEEIVKLLEPARKYFSKPKPRKLKEMMEKLTITR